MEWRASSGCLGKDSEKLAKCKAGFQITTTLRSGCSSQSLLAFVISFLFCFFLDLSLMMVEVSCQVQWNTDLTVTPWLEWPNPWRARTVMVTSNILFALSLKQRAMTEMLISIHECLWLLKKVQPLLNIMVAARELSLCQEMSEDINFGRLVSVKAFTAL